MDTFHLTRETETDMLECIYTTRIEAWTADDWTRDTTVHLNHRDLVSYTSLSTTTTKKKKKPEAHGPRFAHLSDIATADMQMLCNIFPILSSQLMKISFEQFLVLKKNIWA